MKRNLFIIPAIILTMGLTSCNKNESRLNALKFVKENYKNKEPKKPSKHEIKWDFTKSVGDSAKAFAIVIIIYNFTEGKSAELSGTYSFEATEIKSVYPLNEEWFDFEFSEHNDCKFLIDNNNKELTAVYEGEDTNKKEIVYNKDGYRRYEKTTIYIKDDKNRSVSGTTERIYTY